MAHVNQLSTPRFWNVFVPVLGPFTPSAPVDCVHAGARAFCGTTPALGLTTSCPSVRFSSITHNTERSDTVPMVLFRRKNTSLVKGLAMPVLLQIESAVAFISAEPEILVQCRLGAKCTASTTFRLSCESSGWYSRHPGAVWFQPRIQLFPRRTRP
ncbi:uncharacterized protein CC84DRAFT_715307 [Paraphaeosphaeria sporulosa]|uniref:Uncharacterized protein n=1 Tax=Paraphaeosphaeria sporulosa TaxID=1460663 RepID=A0A177CKD0_9PLEO|nr:uncharacterized protein CC84DRAFT_715307 [Paraphaeosphaeria sporulosa]OAG07766.1 hypothetical protein CC84DRAFT_715307 [Paraphaeosphaeria sporulosa]